MSKFLITDKISDARKKVDNSALALLNKLCNIFIKGNYNE